MKKNIILLLTMICSLSFFTACSSSDNDDDKKGNQELVGVYSGEKFTLTYSEKALLGKEASFEFSKNYSEGIITLKNVIPGEATTQLKVTLVPTDKEYNYTFSGEDESATRTIEFEGNISNGKLALDLDVALAANPLVGSSWNLKPLVFGQESPIHFIWETPYEFSEEGVTEAWNSLLKDMAAQLLAQKLENISFLQDGNIVASYKEEDGFIVSPINLANYSLKGNQINVELNVAMIIAETQKSRNTSTGGVEQLLDQLIQLAENGLPINYKQSGDELLLFVDKEMISGFLQSDLIQQLIQYVKENVDTEELLEEIKSLFDDGEIEELIEGLAASTKLEIGLNLVKAE